MLLPLKKYAIILSFAFLVPLQSCADSPSHTVQQAGKHLYKETEYQEYWCAEADGVTEYVLPDRTRVDCLTDEYAIEFDFAGKWAEAIGQSLHYAKMTNKKPGIVIIVEGPKDEKHLEKLRPIAEKTGIKVWVIK